MGRVSTLYLGIRSSLFLVWRLRLRGETLYGGCCLQLRDECHQLRADGFQQAQFSIHLFQSLSRDHGHLPHLTRSLFIRRGKSRDGTVQRKQLRDLVQGEAQLLRPPDEAQSFQVGLAVTAIAGNGARWVLQNPFSLVEANGLNIYSGFRGKFPNPHPLIVNPIPGYSLADQATRRSEREILDGRQTLAALFSTFVTLRCEVEGDILSSMLPRILVKFLFRDVVRLYHREDDGNGDDVWPFRNSE
jgi:hypothetical protein